MSRVHPIRAYRERHSPTLSQQALGAKVGVTRGTISRWETGVRIPDRDALPKLMKLTGASAEDLLGLSSDKGDV